MKHFFTLRPAGLLAFFLMTLAGPTAWCQQPSWDWVVSPANNDNSITYYTNTGLASTVVDATGDIYIAGSFVDVLELGSFVLNSAGGNIGNSGQADVLVAKLDRNGTFQWATRAGGLAVERATSLAVDAAGNVYITGRMSGSVGDSATFGSTTLPCRDPDGDIFVAKLDPSGNWLWVTQAGGDEADGTGVVAVDAQGNSYVAGRFYSPTITFGATTLTNPTPNTTSVEFIAKLTANGSWAWAKRVAIDEEGAHNNYGLGVDGVGNVYVAGSGGATDLGTVTAPWPESGFVYIAKLTPAGNWQWVRRGGADSGFNALTVDQAGNCYVAGHYIEGPGLTETFGPNGLPPSNGLDVFVTKLDSAGNWQWATAGGSPGDDESSKITTDIHGNCYVSGTMKGAATFGATSLSYVGETDVFVASLTPAGVWSWATQINGVNRETTSGIAADALGNTYLCGSFGSPITYFGALAVENHFRLQQGPYLARVLPPPPLHPPPPSPSTPTPPTTPSKSRALSAPPPKS